MKKFEKELTNLINRCCLENLVDIPDFLIAEYLIGCLDNYIKLEANKKKWHGEGGIK